VNSETVIATMRDRDIPRSAPLAAGQKPVMVQFGGRLRAVWRSQPMDGDSLITAEDEPKTLASVARVANTSVPFAEFMAKNKPTVVRSSPARASSCGTGRRSLGGKARGVPRQDENALGQSRGSEGQSLSGRTQATSSRPSSASSRRPLREIEVQARFEALHHDAHARKARRNAAEREKIHQEEAQFDKAKQVQPVSLRAWEQRFSDHLQIHSEKQRVLDERRQLEASQREQAVLRECTFTPRLVSKSPTQRRSFSKARQVIVDFSVKQRSCIQELEALQTEERTFENGFEESVVPELARALDAYRSRMQEFLTSGEGQRALAERIQAFKDANPAIPEDRIRVEASDDIVRTHEGSARQAALSSLEDRRVIQRRQFQIGRLRIIHELGKLDTQARTAIAGCKGSTGASDSDFDFALLERLRSEAWDAVAARPTPSDPEAVLSSKDSCLSSAATTATIGENRSSGGGSLGSSGINDACADTPLANHFPSSAQPVVCRPELTVHASLAHSVDDKEEKDADIETDLDLSHETEVSSPPAVRLAWWS